MVLDKRDNLPVDYDETIDEITDQTHALATDVDKVQSDLFQDIAELIETTRNKVAVSVNSSMVLLYWEIGNRIRKKVLGEERAAYGRRIIDTLSSKLTKKYGTGFGRTNLFNMVRFAEVFQEEKIVHALSGQLSWTHIRTIIYLDDPLKRDFYAEMCRIERWATRVLKSKIKGMLFERTVLSRKPEKLIKKELDALRNEDRMTPDLVFRDTYFLNFLGLSDTYSEKDLEQAIVHEMERFLLELGTDFAFIARQKRITVDDEDYYMDLLLYHRWLRRLVVIDLKLNKFRAEYKGQMELYLRWLDRYDRKPGEKPPLGLILCTGKSERHVELLELEKTGIRVADYMIELPPKELLEKKLLNVVEIARERFPLK